MFLELRLNTVAGTAADVGKRAACGAELWVADHICAAGIARHDAGRCEKGKGKITDADLSPAVVCDRPNECIECSFCFSRQSLSEALIP
jgi:hypothetical protein